VLDSLKKYIKKNHLCHSGEKLLVAVSGGIDSVVLLDLLVKAGYVTAIAHCNFKLRGNESEEDEKFVRGLAEKYDIPIFVKQCPATDYATRHKLTIQEAARNLRYDFFEKLSVEKKFDKVAVAHHADDNLETFFINLFRGGGLQGLKGIPVQRAIFIRPLMFATRQQIETYAHDNDLEWRNDSSNASLKYLRNKIRHQLLPEIKKIIGNFTPVFQSLDNLKEDALVLEVLLNREKNRLVEIKNNSIVITPEETPAGLTGSLWFYYLLKAYAFPRSETDKIFDAFQSKSVGKHFFSEYFELLIDRDVLIVRKRATSVKQQFLIHSTDTVVDEPVKATLKIVSGNTIEPTLFKNPNDGFFDFSKLVFPLTLRKWREGDRFQPYGMKGSKLVSDFFTDIKLSLFEKEATWLLESGGSIIWIVGYRTAEPFKVTKNTEKVLLIRLTK